MTNSLLKTRDAVVMQDSFFIRKTPSTIRGDSDRGSRGSDRGTVASQFTGGRGEQKEAVRVYLESTQRHLDTVVETRNQQW